MRKAPTYPPPGLKRPAPPPPVPGPYKHPVTKPPTIIKEDIRMDFQIEFTHVDTDDKFALDPRDITMVSSFGRQTIIHHHGKETIVSDDYRGARERLRNARVAILNYRRTEELNTEIAKENAAGNYSRDEIPQSSKWSF